MGVRENGYYLLGIKLSTSPTNMPWHWFFHPWNQHLTFAGWTYWMSTAGVFIASIPLNIIAVPVGLVVGFGLVLFAPEMGRAVKYIQKRRNKKGEKIPQTYESEHEFRKPHEYVI